MTLHCFVDYVEALLATLKTLKEINNADPKHA
jgi:hypothetical protein